MASVRAPKGVEQDPLALALWARTLFFKDRFDEAFAAGLAAVELAPDNGEVHDLVASALATGVAPYHLPMLNDSARNRAYGRAIEASVRPGMKVLEIGTGAGLLAMIAARAGAEVFTCELNAIVAAAARVIINRNELSDRIHVINKRSTELVVGEDLPERVDLLMSEVFGHRLFNEGVVSSVADAKARLLRPGGIVLPAAAELRCALVSTMKKPDRKAIGEVEGFDMTPVNTLSPPSNEWLEAKGGQITQRSGPCSALPKDFTSDPPFGEDICTVDLRSTGGMVDGLVQWLRIDFGEGNILENDPFTVERSNWGRPITLFDQPIETTAGQSVPVKFRRIDETLLISRAAPAGEARQHD